MSRSSICDNTIADGEVCGRTVVVGGMGHNIWDGGREGADFVFLPECFDFDATGGSFLFGLCLLALPAV